jgi:hypothetical protein
VSKKRMGEPATRSFRPFRSLAVTTLTVAPKPRRTSPVGQLPVLVRSVNQEQR